LTQHPAIAPLPLAVQTTAVCPDYSSFILTPPLLALSHQAAPAVNFRIIGFEKDTVGELLEQGAIYVALGVFPNPPRQTQQEPIFEERFLGIAR
jgi:DNA-binding transcriptional LysR family regulator